MLDHGWLIQSHVDSVWSRTIGLKGKHAWKIQKEITVLLRSSAGSIPPLEVDFAFSFARKTSSLAQLFSSLIQTWDHKSMFHLSSLVYDIQVFFSVPAAQNSNHKKHSTCSFWTFSQESSTPKHHPLIIGNNCIIIYPEYAFYNRFQTYETVGMMKFPNIYIYTYT